MAKILARTGRFLVLYLLIVALASFMFLRLPGSFLPTEDQGYLIANVQLPPGATQTRTLAVMQQAEAFFLKQPEVDQMVSVLGFSFSGSGQNAALAFVTLKPWDERKGAEHSATAIAGRAYAALSKLRDAFIFALVPPAIPELGTATGFAFRLEDRGGNGHAALLAARNQMLGMAAQSKVLAGVRPDGLEDAPQLELQIDRDRANALGVTFDNINAVLSTALGSDYVNDFPNAGRLQRVVVQADAPYRMQADDLLALNVAQRPRPARADVGAGDDALGDRADPDDPLQRLSGDAHRRRRGARLFDRRRHERDGAARLATAAGLRLRMDRAVARGAPLGLDRDDPARLLDAGRVPVPRRRSTRAGRFRSRCCSRCRSACSARCLARRCAACRTTSSSRSA